MVYSGAMTKRNENQWPQPYLRGGNDTRYRFTVKKGYEITNPEATMQGFDTIEEAEEWAQRYADVDGINYVITDWATAFGRVVGPK